MLHPDGVEVFVKCMNRSRGCFREYPEPTSQPSSSPNDKIERIISVSQEERFAVHVAFKDRFDFGDSSHVHVSIEIDERAAEWDEVYSKEQIKESPVTVIDRFRFTQDGFWRESTMSFERLVNDPGSEGEPVFRDVGTIRVSIRRGMGEKQAWKQWTVTREITGTSHTKLIDSGITLFAKPQLKTTRQLTVLPKPLALKEPVHDKGLAFLFRYRTEATLKLLGFKCWSDASQVNKIPHFMLPSRPRNAPPSKIPNITKNSSVIVPKKSTKRLMVPSPEVSKISQPGVSQTTVKNGSIGGRAKQPCKSSPLSKKQKVHYDEDDEDDEYADLELLATVKMEIKQENVEENELPMTSLLAKFQAAQTASLVSSIPVPKKQNYFDLTTSPLPSLSSQSTVRQFFQPKPHESVAPAAKDERNLQGMSEEELRIELQKLAVLQELERRKK